MKPALALLSVLALVGCNNSTRTGNYDPAPAATAQNYATGDQVLDTSKIPYLTQAQRADVAHDFSLAGNRQRYTLAVSRSGNWAVDNSQAISSAARSRAALARCQGLANEPCGLALVDGQPVAFVETPVNP